jgi:hypothetical protein
VRKSEIAGAVVGVVKVERLTGQHQSAAARAWQAIRIR